MATTISSGRFRMFKVSVENLLDLYEKINASEHQADLPNDKSGFYEVTLHSAYCAFWYREIVANEQLVLEDGEFKRRDFYTVDDACFVLFRDFALVWGKTDAMKIGSFMVAKHAGIEFRPCNISPASLVGLSDHMSQIKGMKFAKMKHPTFRNVSIDGAMETAADLAPFDGYTENVKQVKGVMNSPEGVRTFTFNVDGKIAITKKKDEELSPELVTWLFKLVSRQANPDGGQA